MWLLYAPSIPPVHLASVHDLPSQASGVTGIWLSGRDGRDVAGQLLEIRKLPSHGHLPVFVDEELPFGLKECGDGEAATLGDAVERASAWRPMPARLPALSQSPAIALVRYLYLRPFAALTPHRDYRAHQAYRYPLAEMFSDAPHPESLIGVLIERGWLEQGHLVDRLRCCDACGCAHLNYVDVCPACNSLNICKSVFIHCFTCSHMAPHENFFSGGVLACPNCHARLRHIGVDYNRPMEQLSCRDCASAFSDARVVARCLSCSRADDPERLPALPVAAYTLSDAGRQVAREGTEVRWYARPTAASRIATPESFIDTLHWMVTLARRHEAADFTLLGMELGILSAAVCPGEEGRAGLCEAFLDRVREQMRDTDLLVMMEGRLIWVGLPHTGKVGAEALLGRISKVAAEAVSGEQPALEVKGFVYGAEEVPEGMSVARFLATLGGRRAGAVSC